MKSHFKFLYFLEIIILLIDIIYAKNGKTLRKINKKNKNNKENYYLIYVKNDHGEFKIFNNDKIQKREESQLFIESVLDEINTLIIDNKNTYQYPEILEEMEQTTNLRKRSNQNQNIYNYNEHEFVYPISSVNDKVVLYAYLSKEVMKKVVGVKNVYACKPDNISFSLNHYNERDILKETGWKKLAVRENADLHLSLISQGKYNKNFVNKYDNNYYYPASAGKDIDVIIFDTSFHFNYSEFSNTNDRTIKCVANIKKGLPDFSKIDHFCGKSSFNHGEIISDVIGGLKHGVANRANVYGISFPLDEEDEIDGSDILGGLQYIYENMIRPHKTVLNFSFGINDLEDGDYYKTMKSLIDKIYSLGGIMVTSAGNDGSYVGNSRQRMIPCEFDHVICVGGFETMNFKDIEEGYHLHEASNHGKGVDIYAPFNVKASILVKNKEKIVQDLGTSFSSPIVVGIIATIMGENPKIKFTKETILQKLYENGSSEKLTFFNGSGILANNGKRIVYSADKKYHGCGIYAGNLPCTSGRVMPTTTEMTYPTIVSKDGTCGPSFGFKVCGHDECCSVEGQCGHKDFHCVFYCKSGYGRCQYDIVPFNKSTTTKKKSTKKTTTTTKKTTTKKSTTKKTTGKKTTTKKTTSKKTTTTTKKSVTSKKTTKKTTTYTTPNKSKKHATTKITSKKITSTPKKIITSKKTAKKISTATHKKYITTKKTFKKTTKKVTKK